ncbi:hypothetical protein T08_9798 [Trichinella sp. T8]|nr:hypothetical protein T08_9798 [Trichinella sp. T8]
MILVYFLQSRSTVYRSPSNCTASLKACFNFDEVGLSSTLSRVFCLYVLSADFGFAFVGYRDLLSHMIQSTVKFTCNG